MNLKNILYLIVSRIIPIMSGTVSTLVITRYFTVTDYGIYAIALSIFGLMSLASQLGISDYLLSNPNINNTKKKELFSAYKLITIVLPFILLPVIYLFYELNVFYIAVTIVLLDGITRRVEEYSLFLCQVKSEYRVFVYSKSFIAIMVASFKVMLVLYFNVSIFQFVFYSATFSLVLNSLLFRDNILLLIRCAKGFNYQEIKTFIKDDKTQIINFSVISVAYYIYFSSDTFMLGILSDEKQVA
jgi:O-antigen/teichoic acid export membrane protein